jgi:hypothetical protein
MNSRFRYAADIIVNFTAAAMKLRGGETPGSIRPRRHAHYGSRHIPCRLAKVTRVAERTVENIFAVS